MAWRILGACGRTISRGCACRSLSRHVPTSCTSTSVVSTAAAPRYPTLTRSTTSLQEAESSARVLEMRVAGRQPVCVFKAKETFTWFSSVIRASSRRRVARFSVDTYRVGSSLKDAPREFRILDIFASNKWFSRSICVNRSVHTQTTELTPPDRCSVLNTAKDTYHPAAVPSSSCAPRAAAATAASCPLSA